MGPDQLEKLNEEANLNINQFKGMGKLKKKKTCCEKFMLHPDSKWKNRWDLLVIILSVENSVLTPYELAYGDINHVALDVFNWIVNILFFMDILITFRTMFRNSMTDEIVNNWKLSAAKYILQGRFLIDLAASFPTEVLTFIVGAD